MTGQGRRPSVPTTPGRKRLSRLGRSVARDKGGRVAVAFLGLVSLFWLAVRADKAQGMKLGGTSSVDIF
jgi:hypothetical protein